MNSYLSWIVASHNYTAISFMSTIHVIEIIKLERVFFIPHLHCNLLCAHKIIRIPVAELYLMLILVCFKTRISVKMIVNAELCAWLYTLKTRYISTRQCKMVICPTLSSSSFISHKEIMMNHLLLGYPNFLYLKRLFSSLFINKDIFSI